MDYLQEAKVPIQVSAIRAAVRSNVQLIEQLHDLQVSQRRALHVLQEGEANQ